MFSLFFKLKKDMAQEKVGHRNRADPETFKDIFCFLDTAGLSKNIRLLLFI